MIFVKSVIGDGYDLFLDRNSGNSLVLSNGSSDVVVRVSDEAVMAVLRMHKEDTAGTKQSTVDDRRDKADDPGIHNIPLTQGNETPERTRPRDPGMDSGEEYADASGVGSI